MRFRWAGLVVVAVASFVAGGWLLRRGMTRRPDPGIPSLSADAGPGAKLFQDVVRHVGAFAVDSLDDGTVYRYAASGVLDELDDPYAALVSERSAGVTDDAGVVSTRGAYLDLDDGLITVVAVRPNSPSARSGLRAGDILLAVDSVRLDDRRPAELALLVEADPDSSVRLRVARPGTPGPLWVEVERGPVPPLPPPELLPAGGDIAHLRVYAVDAADAGAVHRLLEAAVRRGARGLVLDLRGAVGGSLVGAVRLAAEFLPEATPVATTRDRAHGDSTVRTTAAGGFDELPMVVLVDRGTAGAAEALAGGLQDQDRALVVGEPTFGRGVSLSLFPVGDGLAIRLSTALWLTPSGRTIQRGAAPRDSAADSTSGRPEFRTGGGRVVYGGGGIVPDRTVLAEGSEPGGDDPALALARRLLGRARTTATLLTLDDR